MLFRRGMGLGNRIPAFYRPPEGDAGFVTGVIALICGWILKVAGSHRFLRDSF